MNRKKDLGDTRVMSYCWLQAQQEMAACEGWGRTVKRQGKTAVKCESMCSALMASKGLRQLIALLQSCKWQMRRVFNIQQTAVRRLHDTLRNDGEQAVLPRLVHHAGKYKKLWAAPGGTITQSLGATLNGYVLFCTPDVIR